MVADYRQMLSRSQAGLRFIALMTIFNHNDDERLRQFIADNYIAAALEERDSAARAQDFAGIFAQTRKLRVQQVMGVSEYQAIIILQAQADLGFYLHTVLVEQEYPHKIISYAHQPVNA